MAVLGARFHEVFRGVLLSETELSAKHRDFVKPVYLSKSLPCEPTGHVGKENAKWQVVRGNHASLEGSWD